MRAYEDLRGIDVIRKGDEYATIWERKTWKPVDRESIGYMVEELPGSSFRRPLKQEMRRAKGALRFLKSLPTRRVPAVVVKAGRPLLNRKKGSRK